MPRATPDGRGIPSSDRIRRVFEEIAASVPDTGGRVFVALDGPDGSGKTTFAAHLAELLAERRPVVLIHEDDFLALRETRYRRGRDSPEGFYRDSYDLEALERLVLDPLRPTGSGRYRRRWTDHRRDAHVDAPEESAPVDAVVIVEGMFLHRDELARRWQLSVFLDVPFEVTAAQMSVRDGSSPDPGDPSMRRYVEGQQMYFRECDPRARADFVVANEDPDRPRISRRPV